MYHSFTRAYSFKMTCVEKSDTVKTGGTPDPSMRVRSICGIYGITKEKTEALAGRDY